MNRPAPRQLEVVQSRNISPHMRRVTLSGTKQSGFPDDQQSAYIKLLFPRAGEERPLMRTYTVRHQRPDQIDVDFVIHEIAGPASHWAQNTQPGDRILVGGPGPKKLINTAADTLWLVGDMTALPAISVNLAELPADAKGHAVLEVLSEQDIQALKHPTGIELHWVVNPEPDPTGQFLLQQIQRLPAPQGQLAIWAACEFHSMRALRQHFRQFSLPKSHVYISSYWKIGASEDMHKIVKREDNGQWEAQHPNP